MLWLSYEVMQHKELQPRGYLNVAGGRQRGFEFWDSQRLHRGSFGRLLCICILDTPAFHIIRVDERESRACSQGAQAYEGSQQCVQVQHCMAYCMCSTVCLHAS